MDSKKAALDRLALALAIFKDYVAIQNGAFLFDSTRLAEGLMSNLLSLLCDWGTLKHLDNIIQNHPAIDLLSEDESIGVQVTSTRTIDKVKSTIEKFVSLPNPPQELYIVMICGRQDSYSEESIAKSLGASCLKFDADKNILDLGHIHKAASTRDAECIEKAVARLEAELGKRAVTLLSRFNKSADRVLRVLTSHDLRPTSIAQALAVSPTVPRLALATSQGLQPYLTTETCNAIAEEFNVPADWVTGRSDLIGSYFSGSPWRGIGSVKSLLQNIFERYDGAKFSIVLPDDIGDPFQKTSDEHRSIEFGSPPSDVPVLIYYQAKGKYSDVYVHLGIQPWNILHHKKAAIFLGTALRDLSLAGLGKFQVIWRLWPRELIFATRSEMLLSELISEQTGSQLDETDAITIEGGQWKFADHNEFEDEFNAEFILAIRGWISTVQDTKRQRNWLADLTAELKTKRKIPNPASGTSRIYGGTACDIAESCKASVFCANENGEVSDIAIADARKLIESQIAHDGYGFPPKIIFIDVQPTRA